ncbi:Glutamine amidotransferase type 1 [Fusarium acutatum]|uniref:Glutamine amidotransferase type 1 n=1 Tax=Fusarium acutatum TaxID=78861 RepID=A0A8H4JMA3_9HYPO|nr:Glutamine amidotransferase type 1 [Fusarium acutatum]
MQVLLIKDYSTEQIWGSLMTESFKLHIARHEPNVELDVCEACEGESIPSIDKYDLIILTGGTFNLLGTSYDKYPVWVQQVLATIRDLDGSQNKAKVLGFCWGHQAIQFAKGATLAPLATGPRIGVENVNLTPAGEDMFGLTTLNLMKFHKRYVKSTALGFTPLAASNEIFISDSNKVLSFQGHPEMTERIAQELIDADDGTYCVDTHNVPGGLKGIETAHDGDLVWEKIMKWARQ